MKDIKSLHKTIDKSLSENAISQLAEFGGHSAEVVLYYYIDDELKKFETSGYLIFRTPETYGHWGFVIKGNDEFVATLIKVEEKCFFELYNQNIRQTFQTGFVTQIEIKFITKDEYCILNANGLSYK